MDIFGPLQMAISVVILGVLYFKLYKQEVPKPAWLPIAIVPVIGGLIVYNICIPAYLIGMNGILPQLAQSPLAEGVFGSFFSAFILAVDAHYHALQRVYFKEFKGFIDCPVEREPSAVVFRALGKHDYSVEQLARAVRSV